MLKGFEDAFVDVQASVISLCLELLSNSGRTAEKIYVYLYQNNDIDYIDAFFEQEGKLYTTNDWFPAEKISDFFDCGVEDIEKLIDIAKMLKKDNLNCHLYVAGDGSLRQTLQEQIKENNLENNITLLGNVINLVPVFKQSNLYLSPSDLEGLPTVIVESLLEGVPVIATPIAGSIDIYKYMAPSNSMILSKDSSAESLYECLKIALNNFNCLNNNNCSTTANNLVDTNNSNKENINLFKPFNFDIDKINNETLNRFESLIGN